MKNISKINNLIHNAETLWLPQWLKLFSDNENGGFNERLNQQGTPFDMPKRLLSQCRQIIVYSQADAYCVEKGQKLYRQKIDEGFQYIIDHYHNPDTGGCLFSINQDKSIHDPQYDLYGHAFVLLTCANYYQATKNDKALKLAKTTLNFIKNNYKLEQGFAEALDENLKIIPATRRQNPHMHLIEACIHMYEVSDDRDYLNIADQILTLFFDKFFDEKTGTLGEFFDDNLTPHPTEGHKVESGHHAEWVWLLQRYRDVFDAQDPRIEKAMNTLFTWLKTHCPDQTYGGVYNIQDRQGNVINDSKRIWGQFETLRAAAIMTRYPEHQEDASALINQLIEIIENHYIDEKTGCWIEILNRDLSAQTDHLPATTLYHIYGALKQSLEYLEIS